MSRRHVRHFYAVFDHFSKVIKIMRAYMVPPQVSIHVAASHKASQHQTLISQIQIVGPHAILA